MPKGIAASPEKEQERHEKISRARKARLAAQGFLNSPETRERIGNAHRGRQHSNEHKQKISTALKGKRPANLDAMLAAAHAAPKKKGSDHPNWKGGSVGYSALHGWVRRVLGTPKQCARCGDTSRKYYDWANISGEYKRDPNDWIRLCRSCHRKHDDFTPWNKGKRTGIVPSTAFKPGEHRAPETEFKPGLIPHNKYLEPRPCLMCGHPFQPLDATRKYCGRPCYWASLRKA